MSDLARSMSGSHLFTGLRFTIILGGAAGDITVPGVGVNDDLLSVVLFGFDDLAIASTDPVTPVITDLTVEFEITAANTINNAGGTASADRMLLVVYNHVHPNA